MKLYRCFYVSRANIDPCGPEPRRILEQSGADNSRVGITGVLYFSGDHFAQVLEADQEPELTALMGRIARDSRHAILHQWPVTAFSDPRWYPGWSLGYILDDRLEEMILDLLKAPVATDFAPLERRLRSGVDLFSPPALILSPRFSSP